MSDREFIRLRDRYALARATHAKDVNVHYERLRSYTHGRLTHDALMAAARADLESAQRATKTLRETMAFGMEARA